jgi:IS5 family transposase
MKQIGFSELEYQSKKKLTRNDKFLGEIERITPWAKLIEEIEPYYPKGERGRPPMGIEKMLRMLIAQQCFGLSDEGIEDALYDSHSIRHFVKFDFQSEEVPDATTLLKFRRLLEKHGLMVRVFSVICAHLGEKGLLLRSGTVVDATIISAPSSTKNKERQRDCEMHQTKKGNDWYFGMKAHIGVDAQSGLVHSLLTTAAHESDVVHAHRLLHGEESDVFGDSGYQGVEKREENRGKPICWHIAMKPGKRRALPQTQSGRISRQIEKLKAGIRAKVEHPFHYLKNIFHLKKVRYKGLFKNTSQLYLLFGLTNLLIAKKRLLAPDSQVAP